MFPWDLKIHFIDMTDEFQVPEEVKAAYKEDDQWNSQDGDAYQR